MVMKRQVVLSVMLALVLTNCTNWIEPRLTLIPISSPSPIGPDSTVPSIVSPLPTPFQSPLEFPLATPDLIGQEIFVQQAIENLANRLGLNIDEITVLSVNSVEIAIPDAACIDANNSTPSPVIPVQTISWEIVLTARQMSYTYHVHGRHLVLCTSQP